MTHYKQSPEFTLLQEMAVLFPAYPIIAHYVAGVLNDIIHENMDSRELTFYINTVIDNCKTVTHRVPLDSPAKLFQMDMGTWLHDIGKSKGNAYHEINGVKMARSICERMDIDKQAIGAILDFVRLHNILNPRKSELTAEDNPIPKLLATQVPDPDTLAVLTIADQWAASLAPISTMKQGEVLSRADHIQHNIDRLASDRDVFLDNVAEYTQLSARDIRNAIHRETFTNSQLEGMERFSFKMGPLYQSLRKDRPYLAEQDYSAILDRKRRNPGIGTRNVDLYFRLGPRMSPYSFRHIRTTADLPYKIYNQLIKHKYLDETTGEITEKGLTLISPKAIKLDPDFHVHRNEIFAAIKEKREHFQPRLMLYGHDFAGLAEATDKLLHKYQLTPQEMNLFTGKNGTVVDGIIFSPNMLPKLREFQEDLKGSISKDFDILEATRVVQIPMDKQTSQAEGTPLLATTNNQTIISVQLTDSQSKHYRHRIFRYFREKNMDVHYGHLFSIPGPGSIPDFSSLRKHFPDERNFVNIIIEALKKRGLIDKFVTRIQDTFDPNQPLQLNDLHIPAEAEADIHALLKTSLQPRTVVQFVVNARVTEGQLELLQNDLRKL